MMLHRSDVVEETPMRELSRVVALLSLVLVFTSAGQLCLKSPFHSHRALARCQKAASTKTVSTVSPWFAKETIKMVSQQCPRLSTGLKPGVNETTFEAKAELFEKTTTETQRTQRLHREICLL